MTQLDTVVEQRGNLPAAVEKIDTTHNLTIRELCQMLKADRHWVNQYIVSQFKDDIVRLGTGYGTGKIGKKCKTNWAYLVWHKHKFTPKVECVFLPKQKVLDFINANVVSVTRQTAQIRLSMCVDEAQRNNFFAQYKSIKDNFGEACEQLKNEHQKFLDEQEKMEKTLSELSDEARVAVLQLNADKRKKANKAHEKKISEIYRAYIEQKSALEQQYFTEEAQIALEAADIGSTHRGQIPAVPAQLPEQWYENSKTVADILDYGDTYEIVYRDLFNEGAIRIELALPDPNAPEKRSKKVYYFRAEANLPVPPAYIGYEDYDDIMLATAEFASKFYSI